MRLQICLSTGGKVEVSSGTVRVSQPVQRVHQTYDDGAYVMCGTPHPAILLLPVTPQHPVLCLQDRPACLCSLLLVMHRLCALHGPRPCRVLFSTQPLQSDKYNDPCACAGGAAAARPAGYGLGSLRGGDGMQLTAAERPEPLLPCAHCPHCTCCVCMTFEVPLGCRCWASHDRPGSD